MLPIELLNEVSNYTKDKFTFQLVKRELYKGIKLSKEEALRCIREGTFEQYLHLSKYMEFEQYMLVLASNNGRVQHVQHMMYNYYIDRFTIGEAFIGASINGHFEVVKAMYSILGYVVCKNDMFVSACSNGHLELSKWLVMFNPKMRTYDELPFRLACYNGHIHMMEWLSQYDPNPYSLNMYCFRNAKNDKVKHWLTDYMARLSIKRSFRKCSTST